MPNERSKKREAELEKRLENEVSQNRDYQQRIKKYTDEISHLKTRILELEQIASQATGKLHKRRW